MPTLEIKTFIWRFTFGQYRANDCGSGFRYLVRLKKPLAALYPGAIKIESARMRMGDARAAGPRVPDDVWDFPRVTGNSAERRSWHPTQHPEALMERIIKLSSKEGDLVLDYFAGTGTTLRVCQRLQRSCITADVSINYCNKIVEETGCQFESITKPSEKSSG